MTILIAPWLTKQGFSFLLYIPSPTKIRMNGLPALTLLMLSQFMKPSLDFINSADKKKENDHIGSSCNWLRAPGQERSRATADSHYRKKTSACGTKGQRFDFAKESAQSTRRTHLPESVQAEEPRKQLRVLRDDEKWDESKNPAVSTRQGQEMWVSGGGSPRRRDVLIHQDVGSIDSFPSPARPLPLGGEKGTDGQGSTSRRRACHLSSHSWPALLRLWPSRLLLFSTQYT